MRKTVLFLLIVSLAQQSKGEPTTGRPLRIGVPQAVFKMFVRADDGNFTGFSIDVFEKAWKQANIDSLYNFTMFDVTYDQLVSKVGKKELDAAVGDLQILAGRLQNVDFTVPYLASGITIVVPQKQAKFKTTWILDVFTTEMWIILVAMHILISLVAAIIELGENDDPFEWSKLFRLWCTILSFTEREPLESGIGRILRAIWKLVIAILVACYYANLTSSLTVSKMAPLLPLDISSATFGCNKNSFLCDHYLPDVLRIDPQRIKKMNSTSDYIDAFKKEKIQAAYLIEPHARAFLKMYCNQFMEWGTPHHLTGLAFAFPKGSPLTSKMSVAISELMETGNMSILERQIKSVRCKTLPESGDVREIYPSEFSALLILSAIALTLGILVVVGRLIFKYFVNAKKAQLPTRFMFRSNSLVELCRSITFRYPSFR